MYSPTAECTLTEAAGQVLPLLNFNKQISCAGLPNDQNGTVTQTSQVAYLVEKHPSPARPGPGHFLVTSRDGLA